MKLYDMIQVYSSGSTVIMNMHCIWPVLHMTSCLVAINKNRDMCFDVKNGKKTYFSGEIPVNDCRNVWRGLKSIRLIQKKITYLKSFMQRIIQKRILNWKVKSNGSWKTKTTICKLNDCPTHTNQSAYANDCNETVVVEHKSVAFLS